MPTNNKPISSDRITELRSYADSCIHVCELSPSELRSLLEAVTPPPAPLLEPSMYEAARTMESIILTTHDVMELDRRCNEEWPACSSISLSMLIPEWLLKRARAIIAAGYSEEKAAPLPEEVDWLLNACHGESQGRCARIAEMLAAQARQIEGLRNTLRNHDKGAQQLVRATNDRALQAEAELDALRWLVEVQDYHTHRIRCAGE